MTANKGRSSLTFRKDGCVGYSYRTNPSSLTTSYRSDRFDASLFFNNYALQLVTGSPSETECVLRLDMKTCVSQEVPRVSGKSRRDVCDAIRRMASDDCMLKVISGYPCERLGITLRAFVELLRRRTVSVLYLAASYGVF